MSRRDLRTPAVAGDMSCRSATSVNALAGVAEPQPSAAPNASDTLLVYVPSRLAQQGCHAPISVAAILSGELNDVGRQGCFIISRLELATLRRTMLTQYAARKPLRHANRLNNMFYTIPARCRAQNFPEATSFKTSFSSVKSDTARRSRAFSASSSFMRFT